MLGTAKQLCRVTTTDMSSFLRASRKFGLSSHYHERPDRRVPKQVTAELTRKGPARNRTKTQISPECDIHDNATRESDSNSNDALHISPTPAFPPFKEPSTLNFTDPGFGGDQKPISGTELPPLRAHCVGFTHQEFSYDAFIQSRERNFVMHIKSSKVACGGVAYVGT
ncbi:hypothetical protein V6N13_089814 [Hibiscus sabdariffa]|uniref:Uncharacterized protein n=1 Tax=Hibiscus sabdariffa TaxID=183260 RepID=A0ABR2QIV0_9ROSI